VNPAAPSDNELGDAKMTEARVPDHDIARMFVDRWSPRAYTDEEIPEATLLRFFEAARWAPSSANAQPWHYVYARRGGPGWDGILGAAGPGKIWAARAAALIVCCANTKLVIGDVEMTSPTHAFDTGAAWMSFALQASMDGWHTHGIASFDHSMMKAAIKVPETHVLLALVAIGRRGDPAALSDQLRALEFPNGRRPVSESVSVGTFPG
jgi:nitroreductase